MSRSTPDDDLWARQAALQAEAAAILTDLDLAATVADVGPMLLAGSYVSGLMCWPDLDVMVFTGGDFSPQDVLRLLRRIVDRPGVLGFHYPGGVRRLAGRARISRSVGLARPPGLGLAGWLRN